MKVPGTAAPCRYGEDPDRRTGAGELARLGRVLARLVDRTSPARRVATLQNNPPPPSQGGGGARKVQFPLLVSTEFSQ